MNATEIKDLEIELLIETIYRRYGYDFRNYAPASIKRRIEHFMAKTQFKNISELIPRMISDKSFFESLLHALSITVTTMFREPTIYKEIREKIIPILRTYPYLKIWHAGCATGEEVYSMAVFLKEEGLYERSQIYATDFNEGALETARKGIYSAGNIKEYTANYQKAGGKVVFSDYYYSKYEYAIMNNDLKENIIFSNHNLVSDASFGEMHFIVCQNVLIYFNRIQQDRAFKLFQDSLIFKGFLCIGPKESLKFSMVCDDFKKISDKANLYQKE